VLSTKLNKTDYLFLGIYALVFLIINGYDFITSYDTTKYIFSDGHTTQNLFPPLKGYIIALPVEFACTFLVVFLFFLWLIPSYLINNKNYFLFFSIALIITISLGVISHATWHWSENKPWQVYPPIPRVLINGIGLSAENSGLALGILLAKKYYESQLQIIQIQKKQQETELRLLQAQLNPHFLFNNLNTLDALIDKTSTRAKKYISNLSSLYRYLIEFKDEEIVHLEREIEMIEHYFYLIETRFEKAYQFNLMINTTLENKYLPIGGLQILVENVVKHNKIVNGIPITCTIEIEPDYLVITNKKTLAINNISSLRTGLQNLKERYQLLFNKSIIIEDTNAVFKVTIPIITIKEYHN